MKFTFCRDSLPRVSPGFEYAVYKQAHTPTCARSCTPQHRGDSALLPGFFTQWRSWLGPHFGITKESKSPGRGWAPGEVTFKEMPDAVSAASLLGEAPGRGGCWGTVPPLPAGTCQQGHSAAPGSHGHGHCPRGGPWRALHFRIQLCGLCCQRMKTERMRPSSPLSLSRCPPSPQAFQYCDACGPDGF